MFGGNGELFDLGVVNFGKSWVSQSVDGDGVYGKWIVLVEGGFSPSGGVSILNG